MSFKTLDSGQRETFGTGSVRDTRAGKGRYDLLPPRAIRRLALLYERGAEKYGEHNWEKGQPFSRFADSMLRHAFQAIAGAQDEDHWVAVAWNALAIVELQEQGRHDLDDLPRKRPRLYLAGPMTGLPNHNFDAFNKAASNLRGRGWEIVNPAELDNGRTDLDWSYCMKRDLRLLLECDAVVLLPGWQQSKGAKIEAGIARNLGITISDYKE